MKFIPRKLYAKIEKKLFDRFWENELLNFKKLKLLFFKFKIENNPNIGCRVTDVDRRTDRPTDRRRATAIGPLVDLKKYVKPRFAYITSDGGPVLLDVVVLGIVVLCSLIMIHMTNIHILLWKIVHLYFK